MSCHTEKLTSYHLDKRNKKQFRLDLSGEAERDPFPSCISTWIKVCLYDTR